MESMCRDYVPSASLCGSAVCRGVLICVWNPGGGLWVCGGHIVSENKNILVYHFKTVNPKFQPSKVSISLIARVTTSKSQSFVI